MNCKYCNRLCKNKNSLHQHEIRCNSNPSKIKTKLSDDTIKKISEKMKTNNTNSSRVWKQETIDRMKISSREINKKYWTEEKRKEHSIKMSEIARNRPESYSINNVSGRAKIIEYNGHKLKGSWELKIANILDKFNIKWTNEIKPFSYFWNEKWHLYFPDFYLIEYDKYIEVKGYERERDIEKWKSVSNLIILKEKDMKILSKNNSEILTYIN